MGDGPELTIIFSSFSVKYPFLFHQLLVLAGHWGMRKKEATPTQTGSVRILQLGLAC